ncbi:MAG: Tim44 domain-containing protein [Mailhella sp.]|nr:Tim44 domain-containing protein [Mailhella sp.]
MKKWKMLAMSAAFLAAFAFAMPDYADAARLGGGRSFSGSTMTRPSTGGFGGGFSGSTMNRQTMPAPMNRGGVGSGTATMGGGSMFGGMMGGLLAGSLIGSMLGGSSAAGTAAGTSAGGFGFLDMLLLFGGIYILTRMMRGRRQRMDRDGGFGGQYGRDQGQRGYGGQAQQYGGAWDRLRSQPSGQGYAGQGYGGSQARPADFDEQEFLQGAKAAYVRMQASWDRRDLDDIACFATEDAMRVFRQQAQDDPDPCTTEILMVNATVADVRDRGDIRQVSVVFDVLMREDQRAARPQQVREMWHFVCSRSDGDTWKLDGIDQLA